MEIKTDFGTAGETEHASVSGTNPLATALRDIADDLATLKTSANSGLDVDAADPSAAAAAALAAFTDPPSAAEMALTRTLVNQLRTTAMENRVLLLDIKEKVNGAVPGTVTSADPAAIAGVALLAFTDPPAAAEMALLRTLVNEIRTTEIANRTLAIELKGDVNDSAFGTVGDLLTTKG